MSLVFDTVLFAMTVYASWRHALMSRRLGGPSLGYILLRDGIWIYLSLLCEYTSPRRLYMPLNRSLAANIAILLILVVVSIVQGGSSQEMFSQYVLSR